MLTRPLLLSHSQSMTGTISPQALTGPTLYPWSVGPDVVELQELLKAHGLALKVDGDFGSRTEEALKRYQRKLGLRIDGVAGPATWYSLKDKVPLGVRVLRPGLTGRDVYELQTLLQVNGYRVERHGIFDGKTKDAVAEFQRKHKLDITGVVEPMTWALLCNRTQ